MIVTWVMLFSFVSGLCFWLDAEVGVVMMNIWLVLFGTVFRIESMPKPK